MKETYVLLLISPSYSPSDRWWLMIALLIGLVLIEAIVIALMFYKNRVSEKRLREKAREVEHCSQHDAMTGLSNRQKIMAKLQDILLLNPDGLTAFYIIDVVNLDVINDAYGHDMGDKVILHLSGILKEEYCQVIEQVGIHRSLFMVIDNTVEDKEALRLKADYLVKRLSHCANMGRMEVGVKINMGIALAPEHSVDSKILMKKANIALAEAQKRGMNQFSLFQDTLYKDSLKKMTLEKQLRRAGERSEFEMHYQPRIDLFTEEVCGCEALIRWRHPDGRLLYPNQFIPLAESVGFITEITQWVVRRVATQVKAWEAMGHAIKVSFNISGKEFDDEFITMLSRIIQEEQVNPALLEVEITETAALKDIEHSKFLVDTLNGLGVNVALDDFGTGYSSMTYIKKLRAGKLKIDRSFIEDIEDYEQKVVVDTMVQMGKRLNYRVNVEGVETSDQLNILRQLQVDEVQGWLFSKAVPADDFIQFVRSKALLSG